VVNVTDPSGISRFSRQEPLLFYQVAPQFVLTRLATDSYLHLMKENGDQQHKVLTNMPIFLTVGAVDSKLIRIEKPGRNGSLYFNYKH
jgi:hypothetical protein